MKMMGLVRMWVGALAALMVGLQVHGATLYWDGSPTGATGNPPTAGVGGAGTWASSNTTNWWNGTGYQYWTDAGGQDIADFRGTGGAVTISGTVNVNNIYVRVATVPFSGGTVNFTGSPSIFDTFNISGTTFASDATGSLKLQATGSTSTIVSGVPLAISGATSLSSFEMALATDNNPIMLGNAGCLGSVGANVKLTKGVANLGLNSGDSFSFRAWLTELAGGTMRARWGVSTWNGATSLSANSQLMTRNAANVKLIFSSTATINLNSYTLNVMPGSSASGIELNGVISGAGNVATGGNTLGGSDNALGVVTLGAANTFTGTATTTLNLGTIALTNVNALQSATLDTAASGIQAVTFVVPGNNTYNIGALTGSDDLAIGGNTISVGSKAIDTTFSGVITGASGKVIKTGSNKLTLSGTNTFTGGVEINNGVLTVNATETAGISGPLGTSGSITFGGGTLQYSAANASDYSARISTSGSQTFKVDVNGRTVSFASALQGSGNTLTLSDTASAGTLTLSGANTYTGATTINAGTLALGGSASLDAASSVTIAAGTTFDVSAISSYTWGASAGLTASGTASSVATVKGGSSVSLNGRPVTLNFVPAGFLGDSGHPALTMSAGSLDLTGSTVSAFNNAASPLGAGDYTVVSGGTVTGTAPALDATSGIGNGVGMAINTSASLLIVGGNLILRVDSSLPAATTTLALNPGFASPSTYGDALQFDVTVTGSTPTGEVILKTGGSTGTMIGSGTLSAGAVTITISPLNILAAATHADIVAVYSGDDNNAGSVSSPLTQVVQTKALTIPDAVAQGKLYDGTTAAVFAGTLSGVVSGDAVTLNATGFFASIGPGTGVGVTSTSTLGGASASNYTLTQPTGLTADILTSAIWTATGGGLWNTSGNWQSGAIGSGSGHSADFNTLDITSDTVVNLDSAHTIGALVFGDIDPGTAAGWTLANNSIAGNTLTMSATTPRVTVNALGTGKSVTISAVVAGSDGLTKDGTGTLVLSGANTYSGVTVISNGMIVAKNSAAFGASAAGTTVESGAAIDLGNGLAANAIDLGGEQFTIKGTGVGANGALVNNGANDQGNAIRKVSLGSDASVGGSSRWDIRNSGAALNLNGYTLTKVGANSIAMVGTAVTPGAGAIDVAVGTFSIQTTTTMGGSSANTFTVRNAAMLDLYQSGTWTAPTWSLILEGGSTLQSSAGTAIWAGPVTLNGNATFGGDAGLTMNGAITGASGSLTKTGIGTLTLGSTPGANTYSGNTTWASAFVLALAANDQIPDASTLVFNAASGSMYFNLLGYSETVSGISDVTGRGIIQIEYTGTGKPATVLTVNAVNDYSFNGYIRNAYTGTTGALGLTKTGAGKQTLSGGNIKYTGATTVSEGTLVLADTTAFASDITDDATLELSVSASWTLTKAISGSGQLVKSGSGTLTLSGANSYSGGTTISAGRIVLSSAGAIGSSGTISMNGGTLQFSASNTSDYSGDRLRLEDGKIATFDTAGQNVSFANPLATGSAAATASLTKNGGGTLTLSAANTYKGLTTVAGGVLRIQHAEALGTTNAGVTVASGMRVELVGSTVLGEAITVNGAGGNFWGGLQNASGTSEWQGPVTIGSELTRIGVNTGTFTVSGVIDSGENVYGVMFRPDAGTLVLSGANTYLGDTGIISGSGLVKLSGGANRLPISTKLVFGGSAVSGILDLNGQNQEVVGLSVNSGTANEIRSFAAPAILTINTTNGAPSTFSGKITQNVMLVKKGVDSLTLSGANTYSNGTIVSNGTLRVSPLVLPVTGAVTLAPDGTLDLAGTSPIATPVTVGALTGSGGLLKLSTLDRLQVNGNMAGTLRLSLSDPELLTHGVTYVVAQFVGTPPESVTLEGAPYPWAAKVVIGEIRIVKMGGTCVSFF
jgi:fibronectin-binding autotransporter adhesin